MSESFARDPLPSCSQTRAADLLDRASCRRELRARVVDGDELTFEKDTRYPVTLEELQPAISDFQLLLGLLTGDLRCPKIDDSVSAKITVVDPRLACRIVASVGDG